MQPKRLLATLLAVILICLAAVTLVSAAEASPALKLGVSATSEAAVSTKPVTVQAGDTLEVSVTVAENPGVAYMQFSLVYDPAVLSVKTVDGNVAYEMGDFFASITNQKVSVPKAGEVKVMLYADVNSTATSGTIITVEFEVLACAAETKGATNVALDLSHGAVWDRSLTEVPVTLENDGKAAIAAHDKLVEVEGEDSPCVTAGQKCPTCQAIVIETEANHQMEAVAEVPATCTKAGSTAGEKCKNCDHTVGVEEIPALGHDLTNVAGQAVTCLVDGWNAYEKCTRDGCDYSTQEIIKAKGEHTIVIDPAIDATTSTEGKTEGSHCSVCGEIIKAQETIPVKTSFLWLWILIAVIVLVAAGVAVYFFVFKRNAKQHIGRPGSRK